jgi:hypothetical protein
MAEYMLHTTERKILKIYGPIQEKGHWHPRWNTEMCSLYKDLNIVDDIDIKMSRSGRSHHKDGG